jgi:hypothetical protein
VTISRAITVAAILIVVGIVAAAFVAIGCPKHARAEALDRQRVSDLGDMAAELHEDYGAGPLPPRCRSLATIRSPANPTNTSA